MHRDTTWTCKLRVAKNGHIHFRTSKLLGLLPERDSGRDGQRLLVCGEKQRGRYPREVGCWRPKWAFEDGRCQRPCSSMDGTRGVQWSCLGYSVVSVLVSFGGRGTKTRPQRQKTFSGKRGRLMSCTDGKMEGATERRRPNLGLGRHLESGLSAGVAGCRNWWGLMSLRACPTESRC